jgi:CheY-like chemotaxis protein
MGHHRATVVREVLPAEDWLETPQRCSSKAGKRRVHPRVVGRKEGRRTREDTPSRPQAPRVLIVHIHLLVAEALRTILEEEGIEILALPSSGEEAMAAVRRERPDLILLDLGLLSRGGIGLVSDILKQAREAKIVALTGESNPRLEEEATRSGFHGYLTADTSPSRLVGAIRTLL